MNLTKECEKIADKKDKEKEAIDSLVYRADMEDLGIEVIDK